MNMSVSVSRILRAPLDPQRKNRRKNQQLFFFVLFFYSVKWLSLLMILFSSLTMIWFPILGSSLSCYLNLNLTLVTLDSGGNWFVCFNTGKTPSVLFDG